MQARVDTITGNEGLDRLLGNGTIQDINICCGGRGPHQGHKTLSIILQNGTSIKSISGPDEKSISIQVNREIYTKKEVLSVTNPNFSFVSSMNNNNNVQNTPPKTYQYTQFSAHENTDKIITPAEFDTVFNQLPDEVKTVLEERMNATAFGVRVKAIYIISPNIDSNDSNDNQIGCRVS